MSDFAHYPRSNRCRTVRLLTLRARLRICCANCLHLLHLKDLLLRREARLNHPFDLSLNCLLINLPSYCACDRAS